MLSSEVASNWPVPSARSSNVGALRLAVGLLQGVVLYLLYQAVKDKAWPATEPLLLGPLLLVWLIVPVIFISSLGALDRRQLLIWIPAAAAVLAALGFYDAWRALGPAAVPSMARDNPVSLSGPLVLVSTVGFFIAQSLVIAGAGERRRIASYSAYFETAWKHFVQLSFSGLFVGVVWLVLLLGSELFLLIKLNFLRDLIHEPWFVMPVVAFAFSCAMRCGVSAVRSQDCCNDRLPWHLSSSAVLRNTHRQVASSNSGVVLKAEVAITHVSGSFPEALLAHHHFRVVLPAEWDSAEKVPGRTNRNLS